MPFVILGLLFIVLGYFGLKAFARMEPKKAARWSRAVMGFGAIAVGGLMTLRGLAVFGVPLVGVGLGLVGVAFGVKAKPGRHGGAGAASAPATTMTRREAFEILGLEEGASENDIQAAFRSQMKRNHPDTGGSPALARRIQEARDVLLR